MTRDHMVDQVAKYFDACNTVSEEKFRACLTEDAVHYLPGGMGDPIHGIAPVLERWGADVRQNSSYWVVDAIYADEKAKIAFSEWTGVKPRLGMVLRGTEVYRFHSDGRINEVRLYYASPRDDARAANELQGFPYVARGFADASEVVSS